MMTDDDNYVSSSSNCDYDSDVFKEQVSRDIFRMPDRGSEQFPADADDNDLMGGGISDISNNNNRVLMMINQKQPNDQ